MVGSSPSRDSITFSSSGNGDLVCSYLNLSYTDVTMSMNYTNHTVDNINCSGAPGTLTINSTDTWTESTIGTVGTFAALDAWDFSSVSGTFGTTTLNGATLTTAATDYNLSHT